MEFNFPSKGMNQNISPEILPLDFAYYLENILPSPLGKGMVRHGTKELENINLPHDAVIMEMFPYQNGEKQMLLYVQVFSQDLTAKNFQILASNKFKFYSTRTFEQTTFEIDTLIKINFKNNNVNNSITALISNIESLGNNTVTITIKDNIFPNPFNKIVINEIHASIGNIYSYEFKTKTISNELKTGLSVACVPRSVTFKNTLLICNGVNHVMSWNGNELKEVIDFIKEQASEFKKLNNTSFSFTCTNAFNINDYQNNQIKLDINGNITLTTVTGIQKNQNTVIITTSNNIPEFNGTIKLFYLKHIPAFSFLFVFNNFLWALGPGAVGLNYRSEALRVYYSHKPNSITQWYNENTKTVPSIDLSLQHGSADNIEAICATGEFLCFLGREKSQAWKWLGNDPNNPHDFIWHSTIPIGIVHGNLIITLPNDVYFISQNGLMSFSTLNIAKQFAATSFNAVDPLIREYVNSISQTAYRACRSFKYPSGAFCGFKIGFNKTLVSMYSTNLYAWSLFSGDFLKANCFSLDHALYLAAGNKVYQYADGTGDVLSFRDGKALINFNWILPVVHLKGKKIANKRYEIHADYSSSFIINSENSLAIAVNGDLRKSFSLQNSYVFEFKGDILKTVPLSLKESLPETLGFRLNEAYTFPKGRLKFAASSFWLSITGNTMDGPVYLNRIKLMGDINNG
jgi:hypothetical protein